MVLKVFWGPLGAFYYAKVWVAWSSNSFSCIICFENVERSIWPSSCFACPLRNLPSQPIPSHPCRLVSWPSGLQCCFGSLWEGLASRPSHFEDKAKAHSARTFVIVKYPVVHCRGSWREFDNHCWCAEGLQNNFGWMCVLVHYIWNWLDITDITMHFQYDMIWYAWNHTNCDMIYIYPDILHSTMACRVLAMNA